MWEVWQTLRQPLPTLTTQLTTRLLCLGTLDIATFWKGVGVVTGACQATNYMGRDSSTVSLVTKEIDQNLVLVVCVYPMC